MAYIIPSFTEIDSGSEYTDAYANFSSIRYYGYVASKINVYKDRQAYLGNKLAVKSTTVILKDDDYNAFFTDSILKEEGKNPKIQMYSFLSSCDIIKYPSLFFDPATTVPSLSEDQKVYFTWVDGDIIFNETSSQKEIYSSGQWQPYNI